MIKIVHDIGCHVVVISGLNDWKNSPGVAVDELLDVVHLSGEEWWLENLVDLHVAHAGRRTHLVGQVALVATSVAHHRLDDLDSDLEWLMHWLVGSFGKILTLQNALAFSGVF